MSSYRFTIRDYHAVEEADIRIDGITVLAGVNGSGKSTVSRWLCYVLKGMNEYEKYVELDAVKEASDMLRKLSRAIYSLNFDKGYPLWKDLQRIVRLGRHSQSVAVLDDRIPLIIEGFVSLLKEFADQNDGPFEIPRVQSLLGLEPADKEYFDDYIDRLREKLTSDFEAISEKSDARMRQRSRSSLMEVIGHFAEWSDYRKCDIGISEDGISLISDKEFRLPLSLETTVYYDTQRISEYVGEGSSSDFARMVREKAEDMPEEGRLVRRIIENAIGGVASFDKDDKSVLDDRTLQFRRSDGLVIPLKEAATGVVSISLIYRLLVNGWLRRTSLLVIDEPEAHLHPQLIVEFARILVWLNKSLGVKVMVSSHNPDMVAAIQSIARREGVLETTRFYMASESPDGGDRYVYKDMGQDISGIFESFNIALSRIELYGEEG